MGTAKERPAGARGRRLSTSFSMSPEVEGERTPRVLFIFAPTRPPQIPRMPERDSNFHTHSFVRRRNLSK